MVHIVQMFARERYSVLVRLTKRPGNYSIRLADPGYTHIISAFATFRVHIFLQVALQQTCSAYPEAAKGFKEAPTYGLRH